MADITNTKQLNYSAEDLNVMLANLANINATIDAKIEAAIANFKKTLKAAEDIKDIVNSGKFRGDYTPVGEYSYSEGKTSVKYTYIDGFDGRNIMYDFARFLGSLHEKGITTITYSNVDYTWDPEGTLLGSNYVDSESSTLVSKVTSDFAAAGSAASYSGTFKLDGVEMIYSVTIES